MQDSQQFAKTQLYTSDKIRESLVHIVLEKSLSSLGIYNSVASEIEKRYNCNMHECYRHPEYLKTILEDKHAETYDLITDSISRQLEIFSHEKHIARFLQVISP